MSNVWVHHGADEASDVIDLSQPERPARVVVSQADPALLSDAELQAEFDEIDVNLADIKRQLADDNENNLTRGEDWRVRCQAARRHHQMRLDRLKRDGRKRGLFLVSGEKIDARIEREILRAETNAAEATARAARRAAQLVGVEIQRQQSELADQRKAARIARHNAAEVSHGRAFVRAAATILPMDVRKQIWAKAREMFPELDWCGDELAP